MPGRSNPLLETTGFFAQKRARQRTDLRSVHLVREQIRDAV